MNRFLNLVFLCLCLVLAGCSFPASAHDHSAAVRKAAKSSMLVREVGSGRTIGSATLVQSKPIWALGQPHFAIVTAKHVIDHPRILEACYVHEPTTCVLLVGYETGEAEFSFSQDWAYIPLSKKPKGMRAAPIYRGKMHPGDFVINIGHPWGDYFVSSGMISHLVRYKGETEPAYAIHSFAAPGNSGGGLFDHKGRFIGIVIARAVKPDIFSGYPTEQEDVVYAVPVGNMVW